MDTPKEDGGATSRAERHVVVPVSEAIKMRARRIVRDAIKRGRLSRPDRCASCGDHDRKASDGRTTIHAHHHRGYDHPLDVEWLCVNCHRAETPLPSRPGGVSRGSSNGQSKLAEAQVVEIYLSPMGCMRLSRIYGVDMKTIKRIRSGKQWAHVTASLQGSKVNG